MKYANGKKKSALVDRAQLDQPTKIKVKASALIIQLGVGVFLAGPAFAEAPNTPKPEPVAAPDDVLPFDPNDSMLDELMHKLEAESDGDDEVPTVKPKPPKVHPKVLATYGARQALRHKINKDASIEGYFEEGVGAQDAPYRRPSSSWVAGISGSYVLGGFNLNASFGARHGYSGLYDTWDSVRDRTWSFGISRHFKLSREWSVAPNLRTSTLKSQTSSKELNRRDLTLPFSYVLNKEVTLKALTVAYSTQRYTNRPITQTDNTTTLSTGIQYRLNAKSTFEVNLGREKRSSDQVQAEYVRKTITPKYEYKFSSTSTVGIEIGRETRTSATENFSRWVIVPRLQSRYDF